MFISESNLAALVGVSTATTQTWAEKGTYPSIIDSHGIRGFEMKDLKGIAEIKEMIENHWKEEQEVQSKRKYNSIELFAGGGGLALGMEKAGFNHVLLNEFDANACNTLRVNRPRWNILEGDVRHIDFSPLRGKIDFLSGGFPCQAFSYAGKQGGFEDMRGTLFFELARAVKEIQPKVFMGENVKGLVSHDAGRTFATIKKAIKELGYTLVEPKVLKAIMYQVPQKRERLILIAIRNDFADKVNFQWPSPFERVLTLRDALYQGILYDKDVPKSEGAKYPLKKQSILEMVPQGGDWRDLPAKVAQEYMGGSWLLGGGKTGMARRLSLEEPSLTLTCSPCQKQTERCHPIETRPLTVREYARIQTFPDEWQFMGTINDKYKQIGNAVPVNLAWAVGRSLIRLFNDIEQVQPSETQGCQEAVAEIMEKQSTLTFVKDNKTQTSTLRTSYRQLNLFEIYDQHPSKEIFENNFVSELEENYTAHTQKDCHLMKRVLVGLVKKDNVSLFEKQKATIYYTGKRFPATIDIKKLCFLIPYHQGRGIRDLYVIKRVRIGIRKEGEAEFDKKDLRLIFEIEFYKQLFEDYQKMNLEIWRTYTEGNLGEIMLR